MSRLKPVLSSLCIFLAGCGDFLTDPATRIAYDVESGANQPPGGAGMRVGECHWQGETTQRQRETL